MRINRNLIKVIIVKVNWFLERKWLEERDNPNATELSKDEKDEQFEKDRQAFLEQLNKDWEED